MQQSQEIVMYDSPEAATYRENLSGWVSRTGRYCGRDENMARYDGCTHKRCECGSIMERGYSSCSSCRHKKTRENYYKKEAIQWDGVSPITEYDGDRYFFNEEDLIEYCLENETTPESLLLMDCQPLYLHSVDYGYWDDCLAEDQELPKAVEDALGALNEAIAEANKSPKTWEMGKRRILYTLPADL